MGQRHLPHLHGARPDQRGRRQPHLPRLALIAELRTLFQVRRLWQVELRLQAAYLFRLPAWFIYRERRSMGQLRLDDESFFFGETPYDVGVAICERIGLTQDDVFYDLGCGRGKMVFTAHLATGCDAVGVDLITTYTDIAGRIARRMGLRGAQFVREDLLSVDLSDATAIYVNGFTFSKDLAGGLHARIAVLDDGVWFVSVGRPWTHPRLHLQDEQEYAFSFGRARVWFYKTGPRAAGAAAAGSAAYEGPTFDRVLDAALGNASMTSGHDDESENQS